MDVEDAFRAHHAALFRYLARQGGDPQLAQDAVQETFVRLQLRPPAAEASVRGWLFVTGLNVLRDLRRTEANRLRLLEARPERVPVPGRDPSPAESLELREDRERLRRALADLRERERTALLMREEGFKHREIADALGTTTGTVGTLLARALAKLQAAMGGSAEP